MVARISEEELTLKTGAGSLLQRHHSLDSVRRQLKGELDLDRAFWSLLVDAGYIAFRLPLDLGGLGGGLPESVVLGQVFGAHLVVSPLLAAGLMPSMLLGAARHAERSAKLAAQLAGGEEVLVLAHQETPGAMHLETPSVSLTKKDGKLRLNGKKIFVESFATIALVTCTYGNNLAVVAVSLEKRASAERARRLSDGTPVIDLEFNDHEVRENAILLQGQHAESALNRVIIESVIVLSAQLAALSGAVLDRTRDYLVARKQFGQPLASFQVIQHKFVDLHSQLTLTHAAVNRAVALQAAAPESREAIRAMHAAKARSSETALIVTRACVQLHGAVGFTEELDIGLFLNVALRWASWMGNAASHREAFLNV
jgi:3-oxochol-4-en-24-oyl-CoA dehydrogenase